MTNRYKHKYDGQQAQRIQQLEQRNRERQLKVLEDRMAEQEQREFPTMDRQVDVLQIRSFG